MQNDSTKNNSDMRIAQCVNQVGNHHQCDDEKACQIQKTELHRATPL